MDTEFSASNALKVIGKGVVMERQSSISSVPPVLKNQASLSVKDATTSIEQGFVSCRARLLKESEEKIKARHAHHRQDRDLGILAGDLARKGSVKGSAEMFRKVAEDLNEKAPKSLRAKKTCNVLATPPPVEYVTPPPVPGLPALKELDQTTLGRDEINIA
ncbi:unnamed protein product, partial [Discosporangium mesarthrocarpum]